MGVAIILLFIDKKQSGFIFNKRIKSQKNRKKEETHQSLKDSLCVKKKKKKVQCVMLNIPLRSFKRGEIK